MLSSRSTLAILLSLIGLHSPILAKSISINFSPRPTTDAESVDAGETSVIGIPGTQPIDGSAWNQVNLRNATTAGTPTTFITATQGGSQINLKDSSGSNPGVALKSTSASNGFYANYGNTSSPNNALTGDGGLMQGILLFNNTESLSISGLSAWAPLGYKVYAFFDIGSVVRTYGISMTSGSVTQSFWTADTSTTIDADGNNDGIIEWLQTAATTSTAAVENANYAVFGDFNGDTLTVTSADGTRAALSGLQIVANTLPPISRGEIDVYLLGGQSNMQGTAKSSQLTPAQLAIPEILFYVAGSGINSTIANRWVALQPPNRDGAGLSTFGLEIGLGERLRSLRPGKRMAFIKYAWSGSSLEIDWKPGASNADTANWGPRYTGFVNAMNAGLAALEADGWTPVIRGMCWQQGEQDAKDGLDVAESTTSADDYGANLKHFITRIRQQFASRAAPNGIRFVAGQVLPSAPPGGDVVARFPGRNLVRQAILDMDENSGAALSVTNAAAIPTNEIDHPSHQQEIDGYRDNDEVHQNAAALLAIGRSMADALLNLTPQSYLDWSNRNQLLGGRQDDDDSDGLSNQMEYLLGSNPRLISDAPHPALTTGATARHYMLQWNRSASDLIPVVQFSTNLSDWTTHSPTLESLEELPAGLSRLTYSPPAASSQPVGFFRTLARQP